MEPSDHCIELVKEFEGLRLETYPDDGRGVLTIGYGHTGPDVRLGRRITEAEAEKLLRKDIETAVRSVNRVCAGLDLAQHEFDALVSFQYNTGSLAASSLLRYLRAGNKKAAAAEFPKWKKAGGKVLAGLVRRRAAEMQLFLHGPTH